MKTRYCPDCGEPLELSYIDEKGREVYYCPKGDEEYYFEEDNGYLYAVCVWDKCRTCLGVA